MTSHPSSHPIPMSRHPVSPTDTEHTPPTAEGRTMRELRPRQARGAAALISPAGIFQVSRKR